MAARKPGKEQGGDEAKRLVEELETAKAYREGLLKSMVDGLGVIDLQGKVIAANDVILEMLGLQKEEVLGAPLDKFMSQEELQRVAANIQQVMAGTPLKAMEVVLRAKDGTEIPVSLGANAVRDAQGNPVALFAVFRDIRETKRLFSELEQSKAFIENIFNAIADPIQLVDKDLNYVSVNKATAELSGYREDELIGCDHSKLLVPREHHLAGEVATEVLATGKTFKYERTWLTKDGAEIPVMLHCAPLRDAKGEIIGAVAVVRDMREFKSLFSELEQRKAFIENLFSAIADAVIVTDREGTIVTVNRAATELSGYRKDELVGQNTRMLPVPEQRHLSGTGRKEAIAKGSSVQYERRHQTKDGVEIPVLLHTSPLRDSQGAIIGSICVVRDIREIKGLISELERRKAFIENLFSALADAVIVADREGTIVTVNKALTELLGYQEDELIGYPTSKLRVPEEHQLMGIGLNEVVAKGITVHYERTFQTKDGVEIPVLVHSAPLRDSQGAIIGGIGVIRDIREIKSFITRLARSEERYRALFEHAPDPILVTDANGTVLLWNERAEEHSGYKAEEVIGRSSEIFVPPDLRKEAKWLAREAKQKGCVESYETERMIKDGTRVPQELTMASLEDDLGNCIGFTTIARDISDRKKLERERAEAQEKLLRAESLAAIGQLASGVAHELRQPLSVINNSVYLLKMKIGDADEKVTKHLGILEKEVAISEKIISDLLDFAKPKKLALEQVGLNSVIEQALSRAQLPQEVAVVTELKRLPPLMADPSQLERVFLNVILNAAQAMPDGGKLVISTESEDALVKAEVKDSGIGISEQDLAKVFEPLYTNKAKGIGLGLTMAQSIVAAHQGTIDIESQLGNGTTVTIKLPTGVRKGDGKS